MNLINKLKNSTLFKSAFIYGLSSAFNSALPILILPLLTRYLSPEDYGLVTIFTTLIAFFNVFIGINVNGAIFNRFFFAKKHPNFNFSEYISNALIVLTCSTILVLSITSVFAKQIVDFIQIPLPWIFIAASVSFFQYLVLIRLAILQASEKPISYAKLLIIQSVINIFLSALLIITFKQGWAGRTWAVAISIYTTGIISLILISKQYRLSFKISDIHTKNILKFGLPLVPHTLGALLISLADRFIISHVATVADAGLYQAGIQISMVLLFFTESFNKAYSPWLYSSLEKNSDELKMKIVKFTYQYFIAIFIIGTIVACFPESILVYILGEKFRDSQKYIFWSSYAYVFNGMYLMVTNYIFYSEKTKFLAYITLPCGLLNIILSFYLTKNIGVVGASISMAISSALMFALTWYCSARLVKMPWLSVFKT